MAIGPRGTFKRGRPAATRVVIDLPTGAALVLGTAMILAGGMVAAVNSASPFGHGSWLAAYLVLVGGVSQVVLSIGALALRGPSPADRTARARLALWNAGSLAVPAGVLAGAAWPVTAGSGALLWSLVLFGLETRGAAGRLRRAAFAYLLIVASLVASVVVGSAIAGAVPGAWL
jgi:hypothetical protein